MDNIKVTDLLDLNIMQQIQDSFSKYTKMASIMADEKGIPITKPSNFTRLCNGLIRQTRLGCERCEQCDHNGAVKTMESGKPMTYSCHAGMIDFAAPIVVEGNFIGSFIGGQVRMADVDEEKAGKTAEELGIDAKEYLDAAYEIPLVPRERIDAAAEFLFELSHVISEMAYNNYKALKASQKQEQVAKMQTEYVVRLCDNLKDDINGWMRQSREAVGDERKLWILSESIQKEGEGVLMNIEDTLDYIRSSDGRIQLRETEYSVRDLIRGIVSTIRKQTFKGRTHYELTVGDEVPERVFGDAGHLGQLLFTLIQNSALYAGDGIVRIRVSSEKISYSTWIIFEIVNPGSIPEADKLKVVQKYFEEEHPMILDDPKGVQLGLAQVGRLVKFMYGKIRFEPVSGDNVRVEVRIPQLKLAGD